ncbi:MAG: crotonase/enoyl-CoA hydratase family protein [Hasllibacter sp.]
MSVRIDIDGRGVAVLSIDREAKRNAMDRAVIDGLREAAEGLGADPAVRAVVLTGRGAAFCAGGDLNWMREQMDATAAERAEGARALAGMLGALDAMPKPLIGQVNGDAFGGGVGLCCVCDVAVAAQGARFGLTETRLGLIPATIGPYVAARLGPKLRRVFMAPRIFGADEAAGLGIVARAVPEGALDGAVEAEVAPYLDAAPGAVAEAKALARRLSGAPGRAEIDASVEALVARWESDEAPEGVSAFFERRAAAWMSRK